MAPVTSPSSAEDGETSTTVLTGSRGPTETEGGGGKPEAPRIPISGCSTAADLHSDEITATNGLTPYGRKRKLPDGSADFDCRRAPGSQSGRGVKKIKLTLGDAEQGDRSMVTPGSRPILDKSLLPPEVWHHVFTFCPPKSLGSLLAVNKLFNLFLDPASPFQDEVRPSATLGALGPMEPNAIWQTSRRLFWPQMPAPLRSKTELDMWRLVCSPRCQDCGKLPARSQNTPPDPRHPGPGPGGVAVIWAFGSRMCATCLLKRSDKELDLQISPSIPSVIIPALPFVFLTQDRDVFPATAFEYSQVLAALPTTKLFAKSDVEALQQEFLQVKDMGQGTVGEWLKGLSGRGSDLQHDASKWEKWESSGGTARMCSVLYPGYERKRSVSLSQKPSTNSPLTPLPTQGRQERTAERAAELKAARKAEIERRSLLLDPPLTADILCHIPSFQAATQIVAQLDDDAWERLKPRLLAQRANAEKDSQSERQTKAWVKQGVEELQRLETTLAAEKEARDRLDKNWEDIQAPLRAKIACYADEVVREFWGNGKKITRENCSRFAVDSLLYVRKRFYAEVAKDAAAARAACRTAPTDPPEGPFTQKLTLENMKWIFDTKFKPHTESLRKELFYCNGCEGNYKSFGLEGVIQHYAAKHTGVLSLGSIVVHWRAEWPEHPPFSATVRTAKAPFHPHAPSGFTATGGVPLPANYAYPPAGTMPGPTPHAYPPTMGYGYAPPIYGDHFQQPMPLPHSYQPQPAAPFPFAPQSGYEPHPSYAIPPAPYPAYQPPSMQYGTAAAEPGPIYMWPQGGQCEYQYGPFQGSNPSGLHAPAPPPIYPDLYQAKVEDIALSSREVWRVLDDIQDLPGNVRVFVTIHHLVQRFRSKFYETPPLSMFIDGLSNNKGMRPVRNVNGLVCKACHLGLGNAASVKQDRKAFSLPQLANHFQSRHIEPMQGMQTTFAPLDWVVDMVFVPDLAVTSSVALPANEPQRALLSAALPDAFTLPSVSATDQSLPKQQNYQTKHVSAEDRLSTAVDVREGLRGDNGHAGRPSAAEFAGANFLAEYRISGRSSHSTTSGTVSENDPSAPSDGGQSSSHGRRLNHGRRGFHSHKKMGARNKRGKSKSGGGLDDQAFRKMTKKDDEKGNREEADERAMRASTQAETSSVHPLSKRMAGAEAAIVPQSRPSTQPNAQLPRQLENSYLVRSTNDRQEPNILAALESHLEQRQSPRFQSPREAPSPRFYTNKRDSVPSPDFRPGHTTYDRYGDPESPGRASLPAIRGRRGRSPDRRQVESVYYPSPMPIERRESAYSTQRNQAGFIEVSPRHAEEERLGLQAPRPEDRGHSPALPAAGYRRYDEDGRPQSRAPIEAYEIVHVIDEQGEYYIRRPVRREANLRHTYEGRRARHDPGIYSTLGPVYPAVARARGSVAPAVRPTDQRADPAHYEEYDPRFPAA